MASAVEIELLDASRAWSASQAILGGAVLRESGVRTVGWHDTSVSVNGPAFAVVRLDGPCVNLVGEVLRLEREDREAFVYVEGQGDVPFDLSLSRRAFLHLARLSRESVDVTVGIVG